MELRTKNHSYFSRIRRKLDKFVDSRDWSKKPPHSEKKKLDSPFYESFKSSTILWSELSLHCRSRLESKILEPKGKWIQSFSQKSLRGEVEFTLSYLIFMSVTCVIKKEWNQCASTSGRANKRLLSSSIIKPCLLIVLLANYNSLAISIILLLCSRLTPW